MRSPTVSIGLPAFSGANYLQRCIQMILGKDYEVLELIITDNASTDEIESICRDMAEQDSRIRYYRNDSNIGASGNFNKAFKLAPGEFFKWGAHVDDWHPTMARKCVEVLIHGPIHVMMVYPLSELIDEQGQRIGASLDRIECKDPRSHRRIANFCRSLIICDPMFDLYRSKNFSKTGLICPYFGADNVLLCELVMMGEI